MLYRKWCSHKTKLNTWRNVKIGEGTFVGPGSTILPGRQIGKNVVIGAGAVVTTDIPDNKRVIGIPGRYK